MKKLLLLIFITIYVLIPNSFSAFAVTDKTANEVVQKLSTICNLNDEQKTSYTKKLSVDIKDKNRITLLENALREIQDVCIETELTNHIAQKETEKEFEKLQLFLDIIKPIQNEMETTSQYNSVGAGLFVSTIINQLNRIVVPDSWIALPDITGRWKISEDVDKQVTSSLIGNSDLPSENQKDNFVNFKPIVDYIRTTLYVVLAFSLGYFLILAIFQKDKLGYFFKNINSVILRFAMIPFITIVASLGILTTNLGVTVIYNAVNQVEFCPTAQGLSCIIQQTSRSVQKMDFVKLSKENIESTAKSKEIDIFKLTKFDWSQLGWGVYYFIIFAIVAGGAFYFGLMLVASQILVFLKLYIWYFVSLINLLNPNSDPISVIKKISELLLQAISNAGTYIFVLFIVFNLFKDGLSISDIFLITIIFISAGSLMGYFFTLARIKYDPKKPPIFQPQALKKNAGTFVTNAKTQIGSIRTKLGEGFSSRKNLKNM
jgi:hypothetical protein